MKGKLSTAVFLRSPITVIRALAINDHLAIFFRKFLNLILT